MSASRVRLATYNVFPPMRNLRHATSRNLPLSAARQDWSLTVKLPGQQEKEVRQDARDERKCGKGFA